MLSHRTFLLLKLVRLLHPDFRGTERYDIDVFVGWISDICRFDRDRVPDVGTDSFGSCLNLSMTISTVPLKLAPSSSRWTLNILFWWNEQDYYDE